MATSKWPYSDYHELNMDWVISKIKNIDSDAAAASAAAEEAADSASAAHLDAQTASGAAERAEEARDAAAASAASIASGSPVVVTLAADMTDTDIIYLYMGSEQGMTSGDWYYYDGSVWVSGGTYGSGTISTNARNLLQYVLDRVVYTETGMDVYVNALIEALKVSGEPSVGYTITYALVNVTSDNTDASVDAGESYTCVLTPDTDYVINTVTVTMGGTDITSTAYSNGVVTIASVTGNVVITANAITYPIIRWDYTLGRLPSSDDGITMVESGITASFVAGQGIYANDLSATTSEFVRFGPTAYETATKTVFEAVFTIVNVTNNGGLQSKLSDGSGGSLVVFGSTSDGNRIHTREGQNVSYIGPFSLNTEYKIRVEYESNTDWKLYVDDVLTHSSTIESTYYTNNNRLYLQGAQQTYVKSMKWTILEA